MRPLCCLQFTPWFLSQGTIVSFLFDLETGRLSKLRRLTVAENCPITCISWRAWISREARDPTLLVNCAANVVCLFRYVSVFHYIESSLSTYMIRLPCKSMRFILYWHEMDNRSHLNHSDSLGPLCTPDHAWWPEWEPFILRSSLCPLVRTAECWVFSAVWVATTEQWQHISRRIPPERPMTHSPECYRPACVVSSRPHKQKQSHMFIQ
jgi:hypothetical protein